MLVKDEITKKKLQLTAVYHHNDLKVMPDFMLVLSHSEERNFTLWPKKYSTSKQAVQTISMLSVLYVKLHVKLNPADSASEVTY